MKRPMATRLATREERVRNRRLLFLGVLAIVLFVLAGGDDPDTDHQIYCDMVALYKATNGQDGWPAYDGELYCG
jgi:hypothetical protein